jgi:hypothetical protein
MTSLVASTDALSTTMTGGASGSDDSRPRALRNAAARSRVIITTVTPAQVITA